MWKIGEFQLNGFNVEYEMKVYDEGSEYGIMGGRISKLHIMIDGVDVVAYDREWVLKPQGHIERKAFTEIICNESLLDEEG